MHTVRIPALILCMLVGVGALAQTATGGGRYDQQIQQDVQKFLQGDKKLSDVHSTVEDGIVTLTGTVDLYLDKARAEEKIRHKDRVAGVRDKIEVAGKSVPDQQLAEKVADRLRYDRIDQGQMFNNFALDVKNGTVTVNGQVRTDVDKESALQIVESTPGVKDVVDAVKVLPASIADDDLRVAVARSIYGRMPMYLNDPQAPICIVVDHGHVTLYGVVNSNVDRQVAYQSAMTVPGVFNVENRLAVQSKGESAEK